MGGALALDAAWLFAAFLIILVLAAVGIAARRFLLERGGGTVECGLRRGPNGSWRLGVASYQREELNWFGALGLTMRPDVVFPRRDLTVVSRRLPTEAEAASLGPGMIVVECKLGEDSGQFGPASDGPLSPRDAPRPSRVPGPRDAPGPGRVPGPRDAPGPGGVPGRGGAPGRGGVPGPGGAPSAGGVPGTAGVPGLGGADDAAGASGPGGTIELAMGEAALTGLLAWLEAAPPGSHLGVAL